MSVVIKAGSYCPIHGGIILVDCHHKANEFSNRGNYISCLERQNDSLIDASRIALKTLQDIEGTPDTAHHNVSDVIAYLEISLKHTNPSDHTLFMYSSKDMFNLLTRYRDALAKERERALEDFKIRMNRFASTQPQEKFNAIIDAIEQVEFEIEKLKGTGHE